MEPRTSHSRSISGKWVLLALLVTLCLLPLITWVTLRQVEEALAIDTPPLSWAERATWPSPPIKRLTLERSQSPGYYATGRWRPFEFSFGTATVQAIEHAGRERLAAAKTDEERSAIEAETREQLAAANARIEAAVTECDALARLADPELGTVPAAAVPATTFTDVAVRDRLAQLASQHADLFYPKYLLGTWHRLTGDAAAAERLYEEAFALAPAVVKLRYRTPAGEPVTGVDAGSLELALDRVIPDDKLTPDINENALDQSLKLVYPRLTTDESGCLYLPAFHTVYRFTALPEPAGYHARHYIEGWFQFPGRIGSPKPTLVWKQ